VASRPGHVQWRSTIEVPDRRGAIEVTIPTLQAIATDTRTAPALAPAAPPARRPPTPSDTTPRAAGSVAPSSQRTWALVVGGVGLVGLGTAGVFSVLAIDKNDQSKGHCDPNDASRCSATGDALRDDARAYADVATVSTVLGVIGLGTGIVLGVTAPSSQPGWSAGVGDRRVWLRSTF
jgi:hypothetical protein